MKITIDAESCTGHGCCYSVAPALFEPDDEGRGVVVTADAPPSSSIRPDALRPAAPSAP